MDIYPIQLPCTSLFSMYYPLIIHSNWHYDMADKFFCELK